MTEIRTILFATDFSEDAEKAGDYVLYLAGLTGAKVHVLHVLGELADPRRSQIQPEAFSILEREVELHAVREMEQFCKGKFGDKVSYANQIVLGIPFQQILRRAQELPADLIVLGTHGRTGTDHVIIGSTAERVVRRSTIPVLTVRTG